ncbi:hypothetical protein ATANTOWER_019471 [Ataeniobius toweri]|uniref:Uncharacterized protein n=1 Tax=Ataeniobius toweri TaxID=208326 RepID=A0ABU7CF87_9TELE|nr:hypothetical protein [Ataeniobius toweri]
MHVATVERKNSLLTGRNLQQIQAQCEQPSTTTDWGLERTEPQREQRCTDPEVISMGRKSSKFSQRLSLVIDCSQPQKNPDQAPAGSLFLRYSFLACTHPVHPPTIRSAQTLLVDSQKKSPWISRLISHLPGGSRPPCTPPPVPV